MKNHIYCVAKTIEILFSNHKRMPTYINESNYMQMNRASRPLPNSWSYSNNGHQLDQGLIDRHAYGQAYDLDCKQVLRHIQYCPVCQHVFALKTPPTKIMTTQTSSINSPFLQSPTLREGSTFFQSPLSNKIEISTSTLILFSVFLLIFFIYIIKTSRNS
jgi:hypothetical protein